jgi:hypothetical protein
MAELAGLDDLVPRHVREAVAARFWEPTATSPTFEALRSVPSFLDTPSHHPDLSADHGPDRDLRRALGHAEG